MMFPVPFCVPDNVLVDRLEPGQTLHTKQGLLHSQRIQHALRLTSLHIAEHLLKQVKLISLVQTYALPQPALESKRALASQVIAIDSRRECIDQRVQILAGVTELAVEQLCGSRCERTREHFSLIRQGSSSPHISKLSNFRLQGFHGGVHR